MSISRLVEFLRKEPLVHFLVIGLCLFIWQSRNQPDSDENSLNTIRVGEQQLVRFLQYQSGIPDRNEALQQLSNLSVEQLNLLSQAYVEEEVLVREALSLGLDKNDQAMRQRLVQKTRYALQTFAVENSGPTETEIADYYQVNRDRYWVEPFVTFSHIFFSSTDQTPEEALQRASSAMESLNKPDSNAASFQYGDRFLYNRNYARRSFADIESHFGREMAIELFSWRSPSGTWRGPVESEHGLHLILLSDMQPGYLPDLSEVKTDVTDDFMFERQQEQLQEAIQKLISNYRIIVQYPDDPGLDVAESGNAR